MEWSTFFASLFSSVGGAVGISIIILRFAMKRTEGYVDNVIQHRFDKKLEEYKQKLNKQFSNYETFSKRYYDCIENIVKQLIEIEKYLNITQNGIKKCLDEGLTLDYIFNQQDNSNAIVKLSGIVEELIEVGVSCRICLPDQLTDGIEVLLNKINEYITGIKQEIGEVQINRITSERLLDSGKSIHNNVESLSKHIKEESLRQSGEL